MFFFISFCVKPVSMTCLFSISITRYQIKVLLITILIEFLINVISFQFSFAIIMFTIYVISYPLFSRY